MLHLFTTEYVISERSKGEVLVFLREAMQKVSRKRTSDEEAGTSIPAGTQRHQGSTSEKVEVERQTAVFHWKDVCYDIKVKGEPRRILDNIDSWIKPGTLTALMVSSPLQGSTCLCRTYWDSASQRQI